MIAGAIGGAGRLNFSVIGDAVNVAARVEAHTRETGDDILITGETRDRLARPVEAESRGSVALKGVSEPVDLYAVTLAGDETAPTSAAPATAGRSLGRRLRRPRIRL